MYTTVFPTIDNVQTLAKELRTKGYKCFVCNKKVINVKYDSFDEYLKIKKFSRKFEEKF